MSLDYTRPIRVKGTHQKVEILRTDFPGIWPILAVITKADGWQYTATWERDCHDWENVPASKRSGTVWVNVYEDAVGGIDIGVGANPSRKGAEAGYNRLASVEVHWTEGEGL